MEYRKRQTWEGKELKWKKKDGEGEDRKGEGKSGKERRTVEEARR